MVDERGVFLFRYSTGELHEKVSGDGHRPQTAELNEQMCTYLGPCSFIP